MGAACDACVSEHDTQPVARWVGTALLSWRKSRRDAGAQRTSRRSFLPGQHVLAPDPHLSSGDSETRVKSFPLLLFHLWLPVYEMRKMGPQ